MRITIPNRYRIYVSSFLMDMVCAFVVGAAAVYAIELGAGPMHLGLLGATGAAFYIISCILSGKLCDLLSRKAIILSSSVLVALSCLMLTRAAARLFLARPSGSSCRQPPRKKPGHHSG